MQNLSPITVIKASGNKEPFSEEKITRSLAMSGLPLDTASKTVVDLKNHLKDSMTTDSIYGRVASFLQKNAPLEDYFNYGLKRAIMALGPTGHPFEIIISDLLRLDGYKTEVGVITQGKCVTHEIDVIAQKGEAKYYVECKYHNTPGTKTDIRVALYTHARFLDVNSIQTGNNPQQNSHSWLITNTKVTTEVSSYCSCVGQKVTTWTSPHGHSLQEMIIAARLHPVTLLFQISPNDITSLLDRGIVTCARFKTAILNEEVNDLFDQDKRSLLMAAINSIIKSNE
jgi:hypothetical protein